MTLLSRRAFLAGAAGVAGCAAVSSCGSDRDGAATPGGSAAEASGEVFLVASIPDGIFEVGAPARPVFAAIDGGSGQVPRTEAPAEIPVEITLDGTVFDSTALSRHDVGIPTPYFPYAFTPEEPGVYEFVPGDTGVPATITVVPTGEAALPQPGAAMIPADTPTFTDPRGFAQVCTLAPEPCPLHDLTLTEALATDGPTLLYVGSPAYCQTVPQICGPTLDLVLAAHDERPEFSMVHAEVWVDECNLARIDECTPAPVIETYGLVFEPVAFIADASGRITARLDATWDRDDLAAALDTAV